MARMVPEIKGRKVPKTATSLRSYLELLRRSLASATEGRVLEMCRFEAT